jgi:hypothetical protein
VSLHVFVDESRRRSNYLIAATYLDPGQLRPTRTMLRSLLMPGQRELHFKKETPQRRKLVLSQMADAGLRCWIYTADCSNDLEAARQSCLAMLSASLVEVDACRLVLDSRDDRDRLDVATIRRVLGKAARESGLSYEHLCSHQEELLWIADAVAWAYGAGGDWARRVDSIVTGVIEAR